MASGSSDELGTPTGEGQTVFPPMRHEGPEFESSTFSEGHFPGPKGQAVEVILSTGVTTYYVYGPENGRRIVLVHGETGPLLQCWLEGGRGLNSCLSCGVLGITLPALIFKDLAIALAEKGFRVIAYGMEVAIGVPCRG